MWPLCGASLICATIALGCTSYSALPPARAVAATPMGTTTQSSEAEVTRKPFIVGEASLPNGFPAPGPVGEVIVKEYPAFREARVEASAIKGGDQDQMFWPLFNHIKKEKIAMSAPVVMDFLAPTVDGEKGVDKPVSMSFVYGEPTAGKPGMDGTVDVLDMPAVTVVSVGVRGSYGQKKFREGYAQLQTWLKANEAKYVASGPPRFLGYNSPMVPWFMRFGEVQIPVRSK